MAKSKTEEEINITPEEYAQILEGFQLEKISLIDCKAAIYLQGAESDRIIDISVKAKSDPVINEDGTIVIYRDYSLTAKNSKTRKDFLEVTARYKVLFSSRELATKDFLKIYQSISFPFVIWPFFREYVNNVTSRMNIPPLTLPFLMEDDK